MDLDPFAAHSPQTLKVHGPRVVFGLVDIVQQRAEARDEQFVEAAARLPGPWYAAVLLGHVAGRLEAGEAFPAISADLTDAAHKLLVGALREIKEAGLADAFAAADDEDAGPVVPEAAALGRLKKKLFVLVTTMTAPFPPA